MAGRPEQHHHAGHLSVAAFFIVVRLPQVSAGTAIMLAVGRFAFLPMHRRDLEKSVAVSGPKTTGVFVCLGQQVSGAAPNGTPISSWVPQHSACRDRGGVPASRAEQSLRASIAVRCKDTVCVLHHFLGLQAALTLTACSRRLAS